MEIVAMNEDLQEGVKALFLQVFSEPPWGVASKEDLTVFDNPLLRWWVAVEDGQIAGFIAGCVATPHELREDFHVPEDALKGVKIGYKAEFGVAPAFRGRRVGQLLTGALLDQFEKAGVDRFLVYTMRGTRNFQRYTRDLDLLTECPDNRVFFGCNGVPTDV